MLLGLHVQTGEASQEGPKMSDKTTEAEHNKEEPLKTTHGGNGFN